MNAPLNCLGPRGYYPLLAARERGAALALQGDADLDFRAIVEGSANSVMVTDPDIDGPGPIIRFVNAAFTRLTGYQSRHVLGRNPSILHGPETDQAVLRGIMAQLRLGLVGRGKVIHYSHAGRPYWVDLKIVPLLGLDGRVTRYVGFQSDFSEEQARYDLLRDMADRDPLTGLANRRAFLGVLEEQLAAAAGSQLAFAFLDVDRFKQVNDTHGHPTGDAVLIGLADALRANTRRADLIGRLGGEEFGVCMPRIQLPEARSLAARLRISVAAQPFATPIGAIGATCSIGLTMSQPGDGAAALLARADLALYRAKRGGRNRVCIG